MKDHLSPGGFDTLDKSGIADGPLERAALVSARLVATGPGAEAMARVMIAESERISGNSLSPETLRTVSQDLRIQWNSTADWLEKIADEREAAASITSLPAPASG